MAIRHPIAMLAELTHRCPLSCPYCSNPLDLVGRQSELSTEDWLSVFRQAAELGVLQLHLSGGEPASRPDLVDLVAGARQAGLYTNLITSGLGLTLDRLRALEAAGLDHVQLSLQGTDAMMADRISGMRGAFDRKMKVVGWLKEVGFPLTLNVVLHRENLHQLAESLQLAEDMGARRVEVATVQFHGWAMKNRGALMPTKAQAAKVAAEVAQARERLRGKLVIDFVPADYHSDYPKSCMGGWGSSGLNIAPDGTVLPCHAAQTLPDLQFDTIHDKSLREIWYEGSAFNAYRGEDWMQEPCRSCERKKKDFGGCRCQALALAGEAAATDPVCIKSPKHAEIKAMAEAYAQQACDSLNYRQAP
ncbi:MAG: pyrroloquinoline quinone biosynthesis protein PqqE [Mangrovicoccus sp.]